MNDELRTIISRGYGGICFWERGGRWNGCLLAPVSPSVGYYLPLPDTAQEWAHHPEFVLAQLTHFACQIPYSARAAVKARACVACGCTDEDACEDDGSGLPCHWVQLDPPVCSACASRVQHSDVSLDSLQKGT